MDDFAKSAKQFLGADAQKMTKAIDAQPPTDISAHVQFVVDGPQLTAEQVQQMGPKYREFTPPKTVVGSVTPEQQKKVAENWAKYQAKVKANQGNKRVPEAYKNKKVEDLSEEEFNELDGLLTKFFAEEAQEPEHAEDASPDKRRLEILSKKLATAKERLRTKKDSPEDRRDIKQDIALLEEEIKELDNKVYKAKDAEEKKKEPVGKEASARLLKKMNFAEKQQGKNPNAKDDSQWAKSHGVYQPSKETPENLAKKPERSKDGNAEENYGVQYGERPVGPGEDSKEDYESAYKEHNEALSAHCANPSDESASRLKQAAEKYSGARKSALYSKDNLITEDASSESGNMGPHLEHKVVRSGGSIGKSGPAVVSSHSEKAEAQAKAKRMNKLTSPGEKQYYGIKYKVSKDKQ